MTELRYTMEFDGRIVAADMERGARIILYCENAKLHLNESKKCVDWEG